jgi:hypothetical protein
MQFKKYLIFLHANYASAPFCNKILKKKLICCDFSQKNCSIIKFNPMIAITYYIKIYINQNFPN